MKVSGKAQIYVKQWEEGSVSYSSSIISTDKNTQEVTRFYIPVTFCRNVTRPTERCVINITNGFILPYQKKDGTVALKLIVAEYEYSQSRRQNDGQYTRGSYNGNQQSRPYNGSNNQNNYQPSYQPTNSTISNDIPF